MYSSVDSILVTNSRQDSSQEDGAFTRIELLIVVATLGLLALLVVPALAGVQHKGGRMQCAANLRQVGMACMIYANDYRGWFPICSGYDSAHPVNVVRQPHYCRYVFTGSMPYARVPTNYLGDPYLSSMRFENLGYLYPGRYAGDGRIFYCPGQWGTPLGADDYQPLLTTDSTSIVRSSYLFNPRLVNPAGGSSYINISRRYQRTSQLEPRKLFAADYLVIENYPSPGRHPAALAHVRERGWNVLFTDGGVQFSRNVEAYQFITTQLVTEDSTLSRTQYNLVYDKLELDH